MPLSSIADGVWATTTPVKFFGIPMSSRTTVAQLPGGRLFVCSPGAVDDELGASVDSLGEVAVIVAPNRYHHLFVSDWRARYPDAAVFIAPSLRQKRPDLADAELLGTEAPAVYGSVISQVRMRGLPGIDETWFFHAPSGTLIDTDLMHNPHDAPTAFARAVWWSIGSWKTFGPSRFERLLTRDRDALRECVEAALTWDFERVIVAHGDVLDVSDAKDVVRRSWSWLLH